VAPPLGGPEPALGDIIFALITLAPAFGGEIVFTFAALVVAKTGRLFAAQAGGVTVAPSGRFTPDTGVIPDPTLGVCVTAAGLGAAITGLTADVAGLILGVMLSFDSKGTFAPGEIPGVVPLAAVVAAATVSHLPSFSHSSTNFLSSSVASTPLVVVLKC